MRVHIFRLNIIIIIVIGTYKQCAYLNFSLPNYLIPIYLTSTKL